MQPFVYLYSTVHACLNYCVNTLPQYHLFLIFTISNTHHIIYLIVSRHWSQVQRLYALDAAFGDTFGDTMSLHNNRLLIGAKVL